MDNLEEGCEINRGKFISFTIETATQFVNAFPWYYLPVTVHKILIHGAKVIDYAMLPIGEMSEEAAEARKKDFLSDEVRSSKTSLPMYKNETHFLTSTFPNGWYSIIESSALKTEEVVFISCLGRGFAVFRSLTSKVYVLDAYCPHMGANIGIGGKVINENVECPFHKWDFRGSDGKCINIPYSRSKPRAIRSRKWISLEINDNIFIWYHSEGRRPWEIPIVKEIGSCDFIYHGRNEFHINCHIQEIPENGADIAHFAAIHKKPILNRGSFLKKCIFGRMAAHQWRAIWKEKAKKHLAEVEIHHSIEILSSFHIFHIHIVAQQVGPSYVQLHMRSPVFGNFKVLQTVTPIEPMLQKVVHRFYASREKAPFMKLLIYAETVMFERDVNIWNYKLFANSPKLVKEDMAIKNFRNWYRQFYSKTITSSLNAKDSNGS